VHSTAARWGGFSPFKKRVWEDKVMALREKILWELRNHARVGDSL
jgi:hypothetical protein